MGETKRSGGELLVLATLLSLQIAQTVGTGEELALLGAFFNVLGDELALLAQVGQ